MATPAQEYMQTIPSGILMAAARGEVDLNALARHELAARGLDCFTGRWVGFDTARSIAETQTMILTPRGRMRISIPPRDEEAE